MTSEIEAPPLSRAQRVKRTVKYAVKRTLTFLLSHVGLTSLVVGYVILGGLIFMSLEAQEEIKQRVKAENIRDKSVDAIRDLIVQLATPESNNNNNSTTTTNTTVDTTGGDVTSSDTNLWTEFTEVRSNLSSVDVQVSSSEALESNITVVPFPAGESRDSSQEVNEKLVRKTDSGNEGEAASVLDKDKAWVPGRGNEELWMRRKPFDPQESTRELTRRQQSMQAIQTRPHRPHRPHHPHQTNGTNQPVRSLQTFADNYNQQLQHRHALPGNQVAAMTGSKHRVARTRREDKGQQHTQLQHAATAAETKRQAEAEAERREQMMSEVRRLVKEFELETHELTVTYNWDGAYTDTEDLQWSFPGAMLYSVTVITTIGYGHLAPKTNLGRVVTMGYAIVGIPLTVLCVRNIGSLLSVIVTGIYRHVFVGLVMRWRLAKARMRRSRRINLIKEVMNDGARRLSTQLSRHWLTIDRHLVRDQELRKSLRRLRKERKRWRLGRMGTRTHSSEDTEPFEEEDDKEEEEERQEDEDVEEKDEVEEDKSLGDIQSKITVSGTRTARVHWKEATKISGEGDIHKENKERIEQIKSDSKEEERKKRVKVSSDPTFTGNKSDSHRKDKSRCEFDPVAGEIQTVMTVQRSGCSDIGVCQETEMKEGGDKDVSCQQEETTLKRRSVRKGRVERTASNRSCDSTQSTRETEDNRKVKMRNSPTKRSVQRRKDKRLERARSVFLEEQEKLRRLLLEATRSSTHKPPAPRGRSHSFDATGSTNDNNDIDAVKDEAGGATRHRQEGSKVEGRRLKAGRPSSLHIRSQPTTPAARRQARDDTRGKQTSSSSLARSSSHRGGRPLSSTLDSDNLTSPRRSQMQGAGEVGAFRGSPARAAGDLGGARDEEDEVVVEEDDEEDEDPLSKPPDTSSVRVPAWVTLLIMTAYILGGAVMFTMWEDDWDFLEGCYFCFITLSTIGFGDFVPGTSLDSWAAQEKWTMCCVYLLFGMAMQSMCFHLMQEEVRASVRSLAARCGLATKNDAMVEDVVDDFQNTETNTKTKEVVT